VGWGAPFAKCTSIGALNSSNGSSILSALSQVMTLWEAPVSQRHNTSRLETLPFKKMRQLHSPWARLAIRGIYLGTPIPWFGFGEIFGVMPHLITIETHSFGLPISIPLGLDPFERNPFLDKISFGLETRALKLFGFFPF
jgi:hypothetical protein